MKKVVLFLMLCVGMMACAVEQDAALTDADVAAMNQESDAVAKDPKISREVMEMFKTGGDIEVQSCGPVSQAPCNGTRNCGFTCCSGTTILIQEDCGFCTWRANSWCGSGVKSVFWY